jgi:hypothetical protein
MDDEDKKAMEQEPLEAAQENLGARVVTISGTVPYVPGEDRLDNCLGANVKRVYKLTDDIDANGEKYVDFSNALFHGYETGIISINEVVMLAVSGLKETWERKMMKEMGTHDGSGGLEGLEKFLKGLMGHDSEDDE